MIGITASGWKSGKIALGLRIEAKKEGEGHMAQGIRRKGHTKVAVKLNNPVIRKEQVVWVVGAASSRDHLIQRKTSVSSVFSVVNNS